MENFCWVQAIGGGVGTVQKVSTKYRLKPHWRDVLKTHPMDEFYFTLAPPNTRLFLINYWPKEGPQGSDTTACPVNHTSKQPVGCREACSGHWNGTISIQVWLGGAFQHTFTCQLCLRTFSWISQVRALWEQEELCVVKKKTQHVCTDCFKFFFLLVFI